MATILVAEEEIWKKIPESDKFYEVSNLGRIRNGNTGKILTPRPTKSGYLRIHISTVQGRKDFYIHRLVAEAFCNHLSNCNVVNHKDNNITNNRASNLEWTTQNKNIDYCHQQHRAAHERIPVIGVKGTNEYYFESMLSAANSTGSHINGIKKCCEGEFNQSNGYKWRYAL